MKPESSNRMIKAAIAINISFVLIFSYFICKENILNGIYSIATCTVGATMSNSADCPPYIIAIDPGHGGMDTGAQAIIDEIDTIDMTAKELFELLDKDWRFIPVRTRTNSDPDSKERAKIANYANASLLISIHANSDSYSSSKGFECFAQPPGRAQHSQSMYFASLIVEGMQKAGHYIRGNEQKSGIKFAYYYGDKKKIVDSDNKQIHDRKSFGILENTDCPAVLVEQCFITNYNDVENWGKEAGCKKAAQLYYNAICNYFAV